MKPRARSILTLVVTAWLTTTASAVWAATFVVNTTTDVPETGVCGTAPGACTFRDAVANAHKTPGRDTIAFDPSVFPRGNPAVILLQDSLRPITDPAGTVIDGAGAGVVIAPAPTMGGLVAPADARGGPIAVDGVVFASAAGTPLTGVTIANVSINDFTGRGLVICGGELALCEDDVSSTLLENVIVLGNDRTGVAIRGRTLTKTQIVSTVVAGNGGDGINLEATAAIVGTRIERSTARGNVADGFDLGPGGDARGTVVLDSVAVGNGGHGFRLQAGGLIEKTKLTGSVAATNGAAGFQLSGDQMIGTTVANVTASTNGGRGLSLSGSSLVSGTVVKDTVSNWNTDGIAVNAVALVTGTTITKAKAAGNTGTGISISADLSVSASKVSAVVVTRNGDDGLRLKGTSNVVTRVHANGNRGHGIRLSANDDGNGAGNKLTKNTTFANDGPGIALDVGVSASLVQKNSSFASDSVDLRDHNPNCGTNVWKQNVFLTRDLACIQ